MDTYDKLASYLVESVELKGDSLAVKVDSNTTMFMFQNFKKALLRQSGNKRVYTQFKGRWQLIGKADPESLAQLIGTVYPSHMELFYLTEDMQAKKIEEYLEKGIELNMNSSFETKVTDF